MKLLSLELEGFGSFAEEVRLEFNHPLVYILGRNHDRPDHADSNGSGKTTILDAISWCLFGQCPGGRSKDDVINHGASSVRVQLITSTICVKRTKARGHGERILWHGGDGDWQGGDYGPTEASLGEALGIDFRTFCNSLYLTRDSKTIRFLAATPSVRAQALAELIDQTPYLVAADRVDLDIKEYEREIRENSTTVSVLTRELEGSRVQLGKLKEEFAEYTSRERDRRASVNRQILHLGEEVHIIRKRMSEAPKWTFPELEQDKVKLNKHFVTLVEMETRLAQAQEWKLEPEPGTSCPMCKREMSEQDCVDLAELDATQAEELIIVRKQKEDVQHELRVNARRQEELRSYREQTRRDEDKLKAIDIQRKLLQDSLASTDTRHLESMIREKESTIVDYESRIRLAEEEISVRARELPILQDLKRGFKSDIRNILFDSIRVGLQYYVGRYLYLLAGDEFTITFPQQSSAGSEKFTISLRSGDKEQDLSCYSEGESWRATFACLLGFRRILLDSKRPFDFLLVDDPVGALDDRGTQSFFSLLELLSTEREIGTILATLPRDLEAADNGKVSRITVGRRGRISYIEEDE